jgi:hypothetical protein
MFPSRLVSILAGLLSTALLATAGPEQRTNLVQAILSEDLQQQTQIISKLVDAVDPLVEQTLAAWRQGGVFLYETNDTRTPFILDPQTDTEGKAKAIRVIDGENLKEGGKILTFSGGDLTAVDTSSKLRKAIKTALDLFALANPNPKMRRDAVTKLGQEQNAEYLPYFDARLKTEKIDEVQNALAEAIALTKIVSEDAETRIAAVEKLRAMRSINSLTFLQQL